MLGVLHLEFLQTLQGDPKALSSILWPCQISGRKVASGQSRVRISPSRSKSISPADLEPLAVVALGVPQVQVRDRGHLSANS